jgi:Tol biopolymer transport system component
MDADGSDVIQLTQGEGRHLLDVNGYTPWSPDGRKLLYTYRSPEETSWNLYVLDIDERTSTALTNEPGQYILPSWSPDGEHIAFISTPSDRSFQQIFVVDKYGNDLAHLTETLTTSEIFVFGDYSWSQDGISITFSTHSHGQGGYSSAYEASLDGSLTVLARTDTLMVDWWNGTALQHDPDGKILTWLRSDSSQSALNLCQGDDQIRGIAYRRSQDGNLAFGSNCSGSGWMFYWANSDGTIIHQLLDAPISGDEDSLFNLTWSPDDQYLAFIGLDTASPDVTETLYVLDVAKAREDPSTQPLKMMHSFGISWQPISNHEMVEQKPTPQPTPDSLAFSLTIQEAEELAGFDVLEPSYVPQGYAFQGAAYNAQSQAVTLQYISEDTPETTTLSIYQKRGEFPELGLPSESNTTPVAVANVIGEVAHGAWVYDSPDTTTPRWEESDGYVSIRWQRDGMSFTVDFLGGITTPPIELQELVTVAESLKSSLTTQLPSIGTNTSNGEWIAYIGGPMVPDPLQPTAVTEKKDVYLIHPDGSGLMNITNSPDAYYWLQWSPDGNNLLFLRTNADNKTEILRKTPLNDFEVLISTEMNRHQPFQYSWSPNSEQIAFIDNRSGNHDIYTIYADGRTDPQLMQLTNDLSQDQGFIWSPDGSQITFERLDGEKLSIWVMNADGTNQREIARGTGEVGLSWSHDGSTIYASGLEDSWLECQGCVHSAGIYRIDPTVPSVQQIYSESGRVFWYLYDSPENMIYFMRIDPAPFLELWGTWFRADGNFVEEIGELDPHQTCETSTGNLLHESISPNKRFSIISNYCAGGFDLYLADRQAINSEQRLTHLLRLPSSTLGQGGDNATLLIGWSPDGRWAIYDNGNETVYLLDLEKAIQDPERALTPLIQPETYPEPAGQYGSTIDDLTWQPRP